MFIKHFKKQYKKIGKFEAKKLGKEYFYKCKLDDGVSRIDFLIDDKTINITSIRVGLAIRGLGISLQLLGPLIDCYKKYKMKAIKVISINDKYWYKIVKKYPKINWDIEWEYNIGQYNQDRLDVP
jgi:hypothetical protein